MMMKRSLVAFAAAVALAGCSSAEDPAESISIGSFSAQGVFQPNVLEISDINLESGEATVVAAVLVDRQGRIVRLTDGPVVPPPGGDDNPDEGGSNTLQPNRVSENGISAIFAPLAPSEVAISITSACLRSNRATSEVNPATAGLALLGGTFADQGCTGVDTVELSVFVSRTNQTLRATGTVSINDPVLEARLGSIDPAGTFSLGTVRVDAPMLAAGGSTGFSVALVNQAGQPFTIASADGAPIDDDGITPPVTPVMSDNGVFFGQLQAAEITRTATLPGCGGRAAITFDPVPASGPAILTGSILDQGCAGTSALNVSVTLARDGIQRTATGQINVADAGVMSIQTGEVADATIRVRGIPNATTSTVASFTVITPDNPAANPQGRTVSFALQGNAQVASLGSPTAVTDADGLVTATILAGRQPGTVSVIATVNDPATGTDRSSQSPTVRVVSGVPIQGSLSLSGTCANMEAATIDGDTVDLQVLALDVGGRPVVDGTEVDFLTNGGAILGDCILVGGSCMVSLRGQAPRPPMGIATILAHTRGQESFVDTNGNGRRDGTEAFVDLPEAFIDANANGVRDPGEVFVDLDGDGEYTDGNGVYDGYVCDGQSCSLTEVTVRDSFRVAFSSGQSATQVGQVQGATLAGSGSLILDSNSVANVSLVVKDINGLPMPSGTTLTLVSEGPAGLGVVVADNQKIADCDGSSEDAANTYVYTLNVGEIDPGLTGQLRLTTLSPSGVSGVFILPITVQ